MEQAQGEERMQCEGEAQRGVKGRVDCFEKRQGLGDSESHVSLGQFSLFFTCQAQPRAFEL